MGLYRLIYASQPFGFDDAMLNGILVGARRANLRDGITGALICRADIYVQLLEGPKEAVTAAFARIARDDRHTAIVELVAEETGARLFGKWAMLDDPARSWMWDQDSVAKGAVEAAPRAEIVAVFERLAAEIA
jgi:hypothetical protein